MVVDGARLERLEGDLPLAIIFIADPLEIVLTHIHRQVFAPVVRVEFEFDEAALFEALHLVGAGAERRLQSRGVEIATLPPRGR